jgi:hypothetical protein
VTIPILGLLFRSQSGLLSLSRLFLFRFVLSLFLGLLLFGFFLPGLALLTLFLLGLLPLETFSFFRFALLSFEFGLSITLFLLFSMLLGLFTESLFFRRLLLRLPLLPLFFSSLALLF